MSTATVWSVGTIPIGEPSRHYSVPLVFKAFVLLMIAFILFGRGAAGLNLGVLYIGDVMMLLLSMGSLLCIKRQPLKFSTNAQGVIGALVLYMIWGACQTVPYVAEFGIMSFRDSVLWSYGLLALAIVRLISKVPTSIAYFILRYSKVVPLILAWLPVAYSLQLFAPGAIPTLPLFDSQLLLVKTGDMAVHSACAGAFVLLVGKHFYTPSSRRTVLVLVGLGCAVMFSNRAGLLSMCVVLVLCLIWEWRSLARGLVAAGLVGAVLLIGVLNLSVRVESQTDAWVPDIARKLNGIFSDEYDDRYSGTKEWRLNWLYIIVDYTFDGEYFWTGKGFGIHLGAADGISEIDYPVRSPHNGHACILARSGVPGFFLWLLFNMSFAAAMLAGIARGTRSNDPVNASVLRWLFCYWAAIITNSSFDVVLEGPHCGFWYWTVIAMGLGVSGLSSSRRSLVVS